MIQAIVAHHTKGRLRLNIPGLKQNRAMLEQVRAAVAGLPEVSRVEYNPLTGSVIAHHRDPDTARFITRIAEVGRDRELFDLHIPVPASAPQTASGGVKRRNGMRDLAGHSLLALGVAGVLLPVIPGTPFLLAGAAVLGPEHPAVARITGWLRQIR
jgi:hypothetical protein